MSTRAARGAAGLDSLLQSLPTLALVLGKGGVGKTTCSLGIGAAFAATGQRTLVVSTDPAGALASMLGVPLTDGDTREIGKSGLVARQLDARRTRRDFLMRWRETIIDIVDRGTYLDVDDIEGLVDAAFPGADEIFAVLALAELVAPTRADGSFSERRADIQRLVVDTAPTGHTLRLLALPETFGAMIALLEAMQAKHRFMVKALTRRYRRDRADAFLDEMRATISALRSMLADSARTAAVLVTRPEPLVVAETTRYAEALRAMPLRIAAVLVNAVPEVRDDATLAALESLGAVAGQVPIFELSRVDTPPRSLADINRVLRSLRQPSRSRMGKTIRPAGKGLRAKEPTTVALVRGGPPHTPNPLGRSRPPTRLRRLARSKHSGPGPRSPLSMLRTLTIAGGKGGVGKTTVSCALALTAATRAQRPVLLVSTDPAPSIGDAFGTDDPSWARSGPLPIDDVPTLFAWQMDATLAFNELRARYQRQIDALFDAIVGPGLDAAHDRAIIRDLLALAPPGVDELYALASLGETLEEQRYERIVLDPAPTGHLLRLLEMPALALDWAHRLMRLMLKYKDVAGLGDAAQELVGFSRRTRDLETLLHDPSRAGVVLVALDEPAVRVESLRLAAALRAADIEILGMVQNRVVGDSADDAHCPAVDVTSPCFIAPVSPTPLVGAGTIRRWVASWTQRQG